MAQIRKKRSRILRYVERHFSVLGMMASALLTTLIRVSPCTWASIIKFMDAPLLQALAGIEGALFGFAITGVSLAAGLVDRPAFEGVRKAGILKDLMKVFFFMIWATGLATVIILVCFFCPYGWIKVAVIGLVIWSVVTSNRVVWLLWKMVKKAFWELPAEEAARSKHNRAIASAINELPRQPEK